MKSLLNKKSLLILAGVAVIATLGWMAFGRKVSSDASDKAAAGNRTPQAASQSSGGSRGSRGGGAGDGAAKTDSGSAATVSKAQLQQQVQVITLKIQEALRRFKAGKVDADTARKILADLDQILREAGGEVAGAAIIAFLETGEDAVTGLEFTVGEGGVLDEAPTMRTSMLDKLGQMSAKDAVEYAKKIFDQARSADEWAVNMRNLAWNNGDKRFTAELESRIEQMLDRSEWLKTPSAGFVEAFDLAVYVGGLQQVANMASVLGLGLQNGLDHAAFLSLDRLTLREPDTVFGYLKQDPNLMSWAPDVRASLMARATEGRGVQREILESYMQDPKTTPEEFQQFADLFPHHSYNLGSRLVTPQEEVPGLKEMAQSDMNSLQMVRQWLADPRFASRHEDLGAIERRLVEYQKQIEAAKKEGSL
jgi:hypothetical protein